MEQADPRFRVAATGGDGLILEVETDGFGFGLSLSCSCARALILELQITLHREELNCEHAG